MSSHLGSSLSGTSFDLLHLEEAALVKERADRQVKTLQKRLQRGDFTSMMPEGDNRKRMEAIAEMRKEREKKKEDRSAQAKQRNLMSLSDPKSLMQVGIF